MLTPVDDMPESKREKYRNLGVVAVDTKDGRYVVRTMLRVRWTERGYVLYDKRGMPVRQVYALSCEDAIARLE